MKPLLLLLVSLLAGCQRGPHVSTQELKSWSSNIEVRVQLLENRHAPPVQRGRYVLHLTAESIAMVDSSSGQLYIYNARSNNWVTPAPLPTP
jgi:hypothetical protein